MAGVLNAGSFKSVKFRETVKDFIASNQAFSFMNTIKGTPAYWKRFKSEVLAMVKQLGTPTFLLTLSCANLRWNEILAIIRKLNEADFDISSLSYHDQCKIFNKNPVLVAGHFPYRVEIFLKLFVVDGPLGKTKYYAIRVEFQVKGSPHIRSVIWILNAPKLTLENIQEYTSLVDGIISAYLPDAQLTTELYDLVKTYQIQHHSKTCHKYKNEKCRFQCGRYFTDHTIIARPLEAEATLSCAKKKEILSERSRVLQVVSEYINDQLNPSKHNIYDHTRENYEKVKSTEEILDLLHISVDEYYCYLAISEDDNFQIRLCRPPNSCFVNNYFKVGLSAWQANMDIQPVFNEHNAIAYMCGYLSKSE